MRMLSCSDSVINASAHFLLGHVIEVALADESAKVGAVMGRRMVEGTMTSALFEMWKADRRNVMLS